MMNTLPDRLAFARSQKLDYAEFLELVLGDEAERRQQLSVQTRINQADFEEECTLERFDWTASIRLDKTRLNDLFGLHFIERKENVIFAGRSAWARASWLAPWGTRPAGQATGFFSAVPT